MSMSSIFSSNDMSVSGCFAAYTNKEFKCEGEVVIIEMPGINFNRTCISTVIPDSPGDLSYIDGCSNSILVGPPRNSDPCINYLYFPEGTEQTSHTHPSIRIGLVLFGYGKANMPGKTVDLLPGSVFVLDRFTRHNFSTTKDSPMSLIVFHPDSDDGPTDEYNPMKSRTFIK